MRFRHPRRTESQRRSRGGRDRRAGHPLGVLIRVTPLSTASLVLGNHPKVSWVDKLEVLQGGKRFSWAFGVRVFLLALIQTSHGQAVGPGFDVLLVILAMIAKYRPADRGRGRDETALPGLPERVTAVTARARNILGGREGVRILQAAPCIVIPPRAVVTEHATLNDLFLVVDDALTFPAHLTDPTFVVVLTGRLTLPWSRRVSIAGVAIGACESVIEVVFGTYIEEFAIIRPDNVTLWIAIGIICAILGGRRRIWRDHPDIWAWCLRRQRTCVF